MDARLHNSLSYFSWPKTLLLKTTLTGERVLCFFLIYPAAVCMMLTPKREHGLLFVLNTDHVYVSHCLNYGSTLGHYYPENLTKEFNASCSYCTGLINSAI